MNLGWIRSLFTLSEIEKGRISEPTPDPRRIESFQDIETAIAQSLSPEAAAPQVTPSSAALHANPDATPVAAFNPYAKPMTAGASPLSARGLHDQDLLKKLLKHRPHYTSNRILRAETAASAGITVETPKAADQEGNP